MHYQSNYRVRDSIFKTSEVDKNGAMTLEAVSSPGKFLMVAQNNKLTTHRLYDESDIPHMMFDLKLNQDNSGITIKSTFKDQYIVHQDGKVQVKPFQSSEEFEDDMTWKPQSTMCNAE